MNKWILRLIALVVANASPAIREFLMVSLNKLEADAKKTANKWDDILVGLLKALVSGKED